MKEYARGRGFASALQVVVVIVVMAFMALPVLAEKPAAPIVDAPLLQGAT